jgi:hypothetical protein
MRRMLPTSIDGLDGEMVTVTAKYIKLQGT